MEAVSTTTRTVTPRIETSQLSKPNPTTALPATRIMPEADSSQPLLSAPASQESSASVQSQASSNVPRLQTTSSNVSQLTNYTDFASPTSSTPTTAWEQYHGPTRPEITRVKTPEEAVGSVNPGNYYPATSPMSVTSPASTNGAKRTASGHIKNEPSLGSTSMMTSIVGRRSRAESLSSSGSRASELAATLKTRLGYAMAKVQHGWEHKPLAEVEQLAAHKMSPNRHSMSHMAYYHRPISGSTANGTAQLCMHDTYRKGGLDGSLSPPPKRHSANLTTITPLSTHALGRQPRLQPPADIRPASVHHRHRHTHSLGQSSAHSAATAAMSPPRTPINGHAHPRRPPTIRTQTQTAEAERDALQALFQLGSPRSAQHHPSYHGATSQASSTQASPLRTDFNFASATATPRKVTFARTDSGSSDANSVISRGGASMPSAVREQVLAEA